MTDWFDKLLQETTIREVAGRAASGLRTDVRGVAGSSTTLLAAAVSRDTQRPVLLVVGHLDEADEATDELTALGIDAAVFPAVEFTSGELSVSPELVAARLLLLRRLCDAPPAMIVAPIQSLMQRVPGLDLLDSMLRVIRPGDTLDATNLVRWLDSVGYARVPSLESPGEFAMRGGIIDIYPPGAAPCRVDLFGDEVEGIFEIDLDTMGSDRRLDHMEIIGASPQTLQQEAGSIMLVEALPAETIAVLAEMLELSEQARSYYDRVADPAGIAPPNEVLAAIERQCAAVIEVGQLGTAGASDDSVHLPVSPLPIFPETASAAVDELLALAADHDVVALCQNDGEAQRLAELVRERTGAPDIRIRTEYLHRGLIWRSRGDRPDAQGLALVPYQELMNRFQTRRRIHRVGTGRALDTFIDMEPGDFVVHRDHGIATFHGLRTLEDRKTGAIEEFLTLEFAGRAKLHVPASRIDLVQRYIGAFRGRPELSKIGGKRWRRQKESVQEAVRDLAAEMLRLQAAREALPGVRYPADTTWQNEFEAEFPYEETDDQLTAIAAVKKDMCSPRPMDRLICGDVGFGKTEIAIRAAFKAAEYGKQVVVLVPTTVLAEQHERTFRERLADYPFSIESLSRFKSRARQKEVLDLARQGKIDITIGTHRLLSDDVKFADLGMVIIDEEQRFGVEHKQKLLQFRATADVLTLSATPIPRTLHMAMLGLRDISSLSTPPLDRRAIVTEVLSYDSNRIRQAVGRELAREGQVFFVHNRVHNIHAVAQDLQQLVPDARIIVGHGQMPSRELESVMLRFIRREADILVCTTIIESGIDIPTANTMFINDADRFGLSDLHQLRGRVGRYKHRAYCYLLLAPDRIIQPVALKRLRAIEAFSMLGAGFKIALRDLEIRGAGNLLGAEQSGHIAAVGYEMYCQLLQQEVAGLKDPIPQAAAIDTTVDLGISGGLPKGYIPSDARRMDAYRRVCRANTPAELDRIERDLLSAYGELPSHARRFVGLAAVRVAAAAIGVQTIRRHEQDIIFVTTDMDELTRRMDGAQGTLRRVGRPDENGRSELYFRPPAAYLEDDSLLTVLRRRLLGDAAVKTAVSASG